MTAQEMITKFQTMVDDSIDSDLALQLVNDAKNEVEGSQIWEQLKALDSSQTETASAITLPTRFALPIKLTTGTTYDPYTLIAFEDQRQWRDVPYAFYIDYANGVYYLTGNPTSTDTIYFFHTKYSSDLGLNDSWTFPTRFHQLIPLKMAQLYYAVDAGEKGRSWDDRWALQYNLILQQAQAWDNMLKVRAKRTITSMRDSDLPKGIANF